MAEGTNQDVRNDAALAIACSQYDVGPIQTIVEAIVGSRRSRKWVIRAKRGDFVLKERSEQLATVEQVAFAHEVQLRLEEAGFPVAAIIGTREGNRSLYQGNERIYELTRLIRGSSFDRGAEQAREAGRTLAWFHSALTGMDVPALMSSKSFHRRADIATIAEHIPRAIRIVTNDEASRKAAGEIVKTLLATYEQLVRKTDVMGFAQWPRFVVHGDWHPGNLLFAEDGNVAGVFDFDTVRLEPRIADVANGALQFSMKITSDDPFSHPDGLNESILISFLSGYDSFEPAFMLSVAEMQALCSLMSEALIAEAFPVIAQTGRFGRWGGLEFLQIVDRKVRWLTTAAEELLARMNQD
ncbi:MAG: phosphotransferase [Phycisphaerales bacterium]|nr:phosphotransferase [Phycisphaerales bacterium]